jgi:nucleotide-binding universal stress UspA family protein
MFKRVLLCHDGTVVGRRALKQGAELAILVEAEVNKLISVRQEELSPAVTAGALGYACLCNEEVDYRAMLSQSVDVLKSRGINAYGHFARGRLIDQIVAFSKILAVDLVVVGQYPSPGGRRWWAGPERACLGESVNCPVLIAVANDENERR